MCQLKNIEKYLKFYKLIYGLNLHLQNLRMFIDQGKITKGVGSVAIFIDKLLKGKRPTIFGSGEQTRDFIFVEDAISACLKTLNYRGKEEIFNIGTGVETSVNQLYNKISKILKTEIKPIYAPPKPGDLQRSCLDIKKAKRELKWEPKYRLEEGLLKILS